MGAESSEGPGDALQGISDQLQHKGEDELHQANSSNVSGETTNPAASAGAESQNRDAVAINSFSHDAPSDKAGVVERPEQAEKSTKTFILSLCSFGSSASSSLDDKGKRQQSDDQKRISDERRRKQQSDDQKAIANEKYWISEANRLQGKNSSLSLENDHLKRDAEYLKRLTDSWISAYDELKGTKVRELEEAKSAYDRLKDSYLKLQSSKADLELELQEEKSLVEALRRDIEKQERVVTKAHSNAISLLARDVSSDFPDDQIKNEFKVLFDRCSEWCIDNRVKAISNVDETRNLLLARGIVNDSDFPEHLRFDMMHKTATAVLLQASLAKTLCWAFLKDPFFLGGLGRQEQVVRKNALKQGRSSEFTMAWRIQTCQYLEQAFPPSRRLFSESAESFAQIHWPLVKTLDQESIVELTDLFEDFCKLSLRLWKLRTNITVQELGDESLRKFQVMFADMEAHSTVGLLKDDKSLNGRPICVVVRPRIVSEPIEAKRVASGGVKGIIWSAAQVWVSNQEAPYEALEGDLMHFH